MITSRLRRERDDRGATLLLVLILMSITSLVMAVVLAQADTAERTTVQLRDQAANNYGADGAMQAVLNALNTSGINCSNPTAAAPATLGTTASPFYAPNSTEQGPINGYAECTPDGVKGLSTATSTATIVTTVTPAPVTSTAPYLGGGDVTLPSYAVMTTGSNSGDFGFDISPSAGNKTVCVENGSVASNEDIDASGSGQVLAVRLSPSVTGQGSSLCTTGTGTDPGTGSKLLVTAKGLCKNAGSFTPTSCTPNSAAVTAPAAPTIPGGTVVKNPAPLCDSSNTYAAFQPGLYTDVTKLNNPCPGNSVQVEWFSPGWYYFDYGTTQWSWPTTVIAGTPLDKTTGKAIAGLSATTASSLSKLGTNLASSPGACNDPDPGKNPSGGVQGVSMVFGGDSQAGASTTKDSVAEFCASSPTASPPVAIYGLASNQGITTDKGAYTIPAETMCTSTGCGTNSIINTDSKNNSGHAVIYIHGYVYAPNGQIIITLKNSLGQVFNWGIVVRNLRITINGSSPTQSVIQLPKPYTGIGIVTTTSTPPPYPSTSLSVSTSTQYSIRYVNVWVCTVAWLTANGKTTCPKTGTPNVQAKVQTDPTGKIVKVLSWTNLS